MKDYPCWYCDDPPVGKFAIKTLYFMLQHPGFSGGVRSESRINAFGALVPLVRPDPVDSTFYPNLCQACLDLFAGVVEKQIT